MSFRGMRFRGISPRRITSRELFGQADLLLAALLALLAAAAVVLDFPQAARIALSIPLVLFIPGYVVVTALLPTLEVPAIERFLLSAGTSLALAIIVGLALTVAGVGLGAFDWAAALAALTVGAALAGAYRRIRAGLVGPGLSVARMPWIGALMVLVAALLAIDVVLGARVAATQAESPPPAQLWLVPQDGHPNDARLGMRAGATAGEFRIVLSNGGTQIQEFDFRLDAQQTWERIVSFTDQLRTQPIVARLYEGTSTTESRFVVLQPATNGG